MQAFGTWKGGGQVALDDGRTHSVLTDLPRDEGGTSAGTTGLELVVLALAGDITSTFAQVARRRLEFVGINVALQGERPKGAATVTRVHGTLRVRTRATAAEVTEALARAVRSSAVAAVFAQARTASELEAIVEPPALPAGAGASHPPG